VLAQDGDTAVGRFPPGSDACPTANPKYVFGHSNAEIRRLIRQAEFLRPFTARRLQAAGVGPGMRVLDLGCGADDVSVLAAELVGPSGTVVGIDRDADVVAVANERVRSAGFRNIDFRHADLETFSSEASFD
jgi:ubiquinone/menaquinone biosynthesis C-methylase UbiE